MRETFYHLPDDHPIVQALVLSLSKRRENPNEPIIIARVPTLDPSDDEVMVEVPRLKYAEVVFVLNQHPHMIQSCFERQKQPPRRTYIAQAHQDSPPWYTMYIPPFQNEPKRYTVHRDILEYLDGLFPIAELEEKGA